MILGVFGTSDTVLAGQGDYGPFELGMAPDLCPVNTCERQLGLDVTLEGSTTRVFEGPPVDIAAASGAQHTVFIEGLVQWTDEMDPGCTVGESIGFVILAGT